VDVAVVGIPDEEWGERIVAAIQCSSAADFSSELLSNWLREQIPSYKLPRCFLVVDELPRNAMGKVVKNDVKKLFQS
jgi:malonyl-CoA/methylmalonyl-CoA synthetase